MSVVTLFVNNSTRGTVTGGGTFNVGTQVTVAATASSGYVFACWSDGRKVVSSNPSYTFTVSEDVYLTAYFYSEVDSVKVYGYCDAKCRHRVLNIGQVISLVQEMAANGFQVPTEFVATTPVNEIIEQNKGTAVQVFVGTTSEYEKWTGDKTRTLTFLTDETDESVNDKIVKIINGDTVVGKADHATSADHATRADHATNAFNAGQVNNVVVSKDLMDVGFYERDKLEFLSNVRRVMYVNGEVYYSTELARSYGCAFVFINSVYGREVLTFVNYGDTTKLYLKGRQGGALDNYFGQEFSTVKDVALYSCKKMNVDRATFADIADKAYYNQAGETLTSNITVECSSPDLVLGNGVAIGNAPKGKTTEDITDIAFRAGRVLLQCGGAALRMDSYTASQAIGMERYGEAGMEIAHAKISVWVDDSKIYFCIDEYSSVLLSTGVSSPVTILTTGDEISLAGGVFVTFN